MVLRPLHYEPLFGQEELQTTQNFKRSSVFSGYLLVTSGEWKAAKFFALLGFPTTSESEVSVVRVSTVGIFRRLFITKKVQRGKPLLGVYEGLVHYVHPGLCSLVSLIPSIILEFLNWYALAIKKLW